jgi:hypothetical protein
MLTNSLTGPAERRRDEGEQAGTAWISVLLSLLRAPGIHQPHDLRNLASDVPAAALAGEAGSNSAGHGVSLNAGRACEGG